MREEISTQCPYCGESLNLLIDVSGGDQQYFEDCQICCRPILITLYFAVDGVTYHFQAQREDD